MKLLKIQSTGDFINLDLVTYVKTVVDDNRYYIDIHFSGDEGVFVDYSDSSRKLYDRLTNLCEVMI